MAAREAGANKEYHPGGSAMPWILRVAVKACPKKAGQLFWDRRS